MSARGVVLAVDQGSSSSRCVVLDAELRPLGAGVRPVASSFPAPGRVEQDPDELAGSVTRAMTDALGRACADWADVSAAGLAAQTETFVVGGAGDRQGGLPGDQLAGRARR